VPYNPQTDGANDSTRLGKKPKTATANKAEPAMATKAKAKATKATKATKVEKDAWVVVVETAPSGWGCHRGPPLDEITMIVRTDREVLTGPFHTEAAANQGAKEQRDQSCHFEDWAQEFYEQNQPPPYDSRDGENYDDDETVFIYVSTQASLDKVVKEEQKRVDKAREKAMSAHKKQVVEKKAKLKAKGLVHYPWPHNDDLCIPAELEMVLSDEGDLTCNSKEFIVEGVLCATQAAQVKTLMVKPKDHRNAKQGEAFQDALVTALAKFTALEEFHWHSAKVSKALLERIAAVVGSTLNVLSIPLSRMSPEDVKGLAGFSRLQKLALFSSFDMEWGDMDYGYGGYGGGYSSDEADDADKPFCGPLLEATVGMKQLKVLDITGHKDFGCFERILQYRTVMKIEQRGVKVEVGVQEHW